MKRISGWLLVALLSAAPALAVDGGARASAKEQTQSPAVEQGKRLIYALTHGSDADFLKTLHTVYPGTKTPDAQWLEFRGNLANLQYHGVNEATPTHADLSVYDANGQDWARILVDVSPAPAHPVTSFGIHQGTRPADVPAPPKLPPDALVAAARKQIATDVATGNFSGAAIIARNGKPIFERAYGYADRAAKTPNTLNSKFRIGSMDKMFTSVAIMQLAQAGKLDLNASIGKYLPDYPNKSAAAKVTVNELLAHAGGVGDFFGPEFEAHRNDLRDPKDYVALFGKRPLEFEPGTRQSYSNFGYIVLGRIVEMVSGQSYDDYVQQHIYVPAHMTSTGQEPETVQVPGRVTGYANKDGKLVPATEDQVWRGTPAGGGYSTVGDLLNFANALMANGLLDAAHTALLTNGTISLPGGDKTHYDFGNSTDDGTRYFGHAGGAPGQNGELRIFPKSGYVIVVLANRDPPAATAIATFIGDRLK